MKVLLHPAVRLLNQLSYPRKLALIALIFFLPFLFSGYLLVSDTSSDIAFAEKELTGLSGIQPLKKFMRSVQEHRGASQLALHGDLSAEQLLDSLEQSAEATIQELDDFDAKFGEIMHSSEKWNVVKNRWDDLRTKSISLSAEENFDLHSAFIDCLQDFMLHIADASGLSLDPSLDTHYLISLVVLKLTQLTESMGQTRALATNAALQPVLLQHDYGRLSQALGASKKIRTRLAVDLSTAFEVTPGLHQRMDAPLKEAQEAVDSFLSGTEALLIMGESPLKGGQAMFREGTLAVDALYRLCEVTLPVLREVIVARSERLVQKKRIFIALGILALLLAAYLFVSFTSELIRQMHVLRQGAKDVINGNLNTQLGQESQDEMATIAYLFNGMVDSLRYQMAKVMQGEEQLRLAATVFDGTDEAIMITDATGTIVSVNRAFNELTGYATREAVGKTPALLKSGRHDNSFYQEMWEHVMASGSWQGEVWDRRKDGELFPAWLTVNILRGSNGEPKYFIGIFSDISMMKESQHRIEYLANFDTLTGLPNRNLFHDRLKRAVTRNTRKGSGFVLMFIDLDNFKAVNDTLGHDAGDLLLRETATRLGQCIRDSDTAARLGGDEFTILLESGDRAVQEVYVTCSIGISVYPDNGDDDQTLMKNADIAMYRAKMQGKNNFRFFDD
ncbi:MAG: diguanylate cyclase [Sulfuricella denitrificans]|nr:diguanylate cyclase [Sulfuricella denitrificans]